MLSMPSLVRSIKAVLLFSTLLSVTLGCSQESAKKEKQADTTTVQKKDTLPHVEIHKTFTDISRFMAGMVPLHDPYLREKAQTDYFKMYQSSFNSSWKKVSERRLVKMQAWAKEELKTANSNGKDLFYPFGGPDFLNVYTLFPNPKNYSLFGLEPVGHIPDLPSFKDKGLKDYLFSINDALSDLFQKSYFITHNMIQDFHSNQISGTIPVIFVFLARTGNQIVDMHRVGIDDTGKLVPYELDAKGKPTTKVSPGIKIDFLPEGQNEVRSVYYFSVNFQDVKLPGTPGVMKYIASLGEVNTYIKSASYLMHYPAFNEIRKACLNQSVTLLQDDSGIAYHYFDKNQWNIKLYGAYTRPVNDFSWVYEKDLEEAYKKDTTIKPVPFTLGYHWESKGVNLLKAIKKQASDTLVQTPKDTVRK